MSDDKAFMHKAIYVAGINTFKHIDSNTCKHTDTQTHTHTHTDTKKSQQVVLQLLPVTTPGLPSTSVIYPLYIQLTLYVPLLAGIHQAGCLPIGMNGGEGQEREARTTSSVTLAMVQAFWAFWFFQHMEFALSGLNIVSSEIARFCRHPNRFQHR